MTQPESPEPQDQPIDLRPLYETYRRYALREDGASHKEAFASVLLDAWSEETAHPFYAGVWQIGWGRRGQEDVSELLWSDLTRGPRTRPVGNNRGDRLGERYMVLRDRAHFAMARAIR